MISPNRRSSFGRAPQSFATTPVAKPPCIPPIRLAIRFFFLCRLLVQLHTHSPFDTNDEDLLPATKACTLCPKRSGCSPLLFPEMKKKTLCSDKNCFDLKRMTHLINTVTDIINTESDTVFIHNRYSSIPKEIEALLQGHKIKPLQEYDDFNTGTNYKGTKIKGFWISGTDTGKLETIVLTPKHKGSVDTSSTQAQVSKSKDRLRRAIELDAINVHKQVIESMIKHPMQKKSCTKKMLPEEETMLWFIAYDMGGYGAKNDIDKVLGTKYNNNPQKNLEIFSSLSQEQKAFITRRVMREKYFGLFSTKPSTEHLIVRKVAEAYKNIPISEYEKKQGEIRSRREERAEARNKALKQDAKNTSTKKPQAKKH